MSTAGKRILKREVVPAVQPAAPHPAGVPGNSLSCLLPRHPGLAGTAYSRWLGRAGKAFQDPLPTEVLLSL